MEEITRAFVQRLRRGSSRAPDDLSANVLPPHSQRAGGGNVGPKRFTKKPGASLAPSGHLSGERMGLHGAASISRESDAVHASLSGIDVPIRCGPNPGLVPVA